MAELSDWDLLLQSQDTGASAYGVLVKRHFRSAVAFCAQILGDHQKAEDVAQRGFLKVFQARKRYSKRGRFRTLLFKVLLNLSLNEIARKTHTAPFSSLGGGDGSDWGPESAPDAGSPDPLRDLESREVETIMARAMERLRPRHRVALYLREYENLSYDEIATSLDASLAEVKVWIHRGRKQMLDLVQPYLERGRGPS